MCQTLCDFYQFEQKRVATTPLKRLTIKRASTSTQLRKSFRKKSRKHGSLKDGHKVVDMDTQALSDMGPFGRRVRALGILINAELDLMKDTLPIEYHTTVLDIIVAPGIFWKMLYK